MSEVKKLIAEAREREGEWASRESLPSDVWLAVQLADALEALDSAPAVARPLPNREQVVGTLYRHIWNGKACACGWNMWDHPEKWGDHAADAVLAAIETASGEVEWEYGCMSSTHRYSPHRSGWGIPLDPMVRPEEHGEICPSPALARRRPAGPWVAIEKGGESDV